VISPKNVSVFHRNLLRWYRSNGRNLPWRRTRDPYAILVSEFMLQQTQVSTVIPYYNAWLNRFSDFASLARASGNDVLHAWQGLGYYARARNLHGTAKAVVDRNHGRFPRSVETMQQLPGIGRYTAHAIASFAFNQSAPIVEANTARVLTRLFDFRESVESPASQETLWECAASLLPKADARRYNSALLDLGALVCLPRKPKCPICPVKKFCTAKNPEALPIKKPKPRTTRLIEKHALVACRGKILLEQSRRRWRDMWILPPLQTSLANQEPIYKSIFPFTNHRVAFKVYAQRWRKIDKRSQRWIRINSLKSIPIPSPHRRALQHLLQ
jgi:A/G-specific adenine glycosylase